ncbi:MAG: hypothetical protein ACPLZD_09085 [Candidatus Saccharicenans sp.]
MGKSVEASCQRAWQHLSLARNVLNDIPAKCPKFTGSQDEEQPTLPAKSLSWNDL